MDEELYNSLSRITEETVEDDLRTELIDIMYRTGFALTGEEEHEGQKTYEFKRRDTVVKMIVTEKEAVSDAPPSKE
jgi:hypothetical protein